MLCRLCQSAIILQSILIACCHLAECFGGDIKLREYVGVMAFSSNTTAEEYPNIGSALVCVTKCVIKPSCSSLNYNPLLKICQLIMKTDLLSHVLQEATNWIFATSETIMCLPPPPPPRVGWTMDLVENPMVGAVASYYCAEQTITICQPTSDWLPAVNFSCDCDASSQKAMFASLEASQFTAFSSHAGGWEASDAVFGVANGWHSLQPYTSIQWIKVNFLSLYAVVRSETAGRVNAAQWVKSYKLEFSQDDQTWLTYKNTTGHDVVFPGNTDQNTRVSNDIMPPIRAEYIRLRPITNQGGICMRWELYVC